MDKIAYEGRVMWSHIDANRHMRHSAYADFAAQARLMKMEEAGLGPAVLYRLNIGPVMFREELLYHREVGLNDYLKVSWELIKSRADGSRWTIRHEIYKSDGVKAATVIVDGAWMDLDKRKLTALPEDLLKVFMTMPRSADYVEEPPKEVKG